MYERNKKWNEERNYRLQTERQRKAEYDLKECCFTPNIRKDESKDRTSPSFT